MVAGVAENMSDPEELEVKRDLARREGQKALAVDGLQKKCRELREILSRFGIAERAKDEYAIDYQKLAMGLGKEQSKVLRDTLNEMLGDV